MNDKNKHAILIYIFMVVMVVITVLYDAGFLFSYKKVIIFIAYLFLNMFTFIYSLRIKEKDKKKISALSVHLINGIIGYLILIHYNGAYNFSLHILVSGVIILPGILDYDTSTINMLAFAAIILNTLAFVLDYFEFASLLSLMFIVVISFSFANVLHKNYRNENTIRKKADQFEMLYKISKIIDSFPENQKIYDAVTEIIGIHFQVTNCLILEYDDKKELLEIKAQYNETNPITFSELKKGEGISGIAFALEKNIICSDLSKNETMRKQIIADIKFEAIAAIPILINKKTFGVLVLINDQPYDMNKDVVDFISIITARLSKVIENNKLYYQIEWLSKTDTMTGLYSHDLFYDIISKESSRATRHNKKMEIIIIDIDRFKVVNDDYGHVVGDEVIKKVSQIIKNSIREEDFASRYGGEEFAILATDSECMSGVNIAKRILNMLEEYNKSNKFGLKDRDITVSIGIAVFPDEDVNAKQIIDIADRKMYEVKSLGGNNYKK
jgi:diguanylate cyclase (GGDEF)-like protein